MFRVLTAAFVATAFALAAGTATLLAEKPAKPIKTKEVMAKYLKGDKGKDTPLSIAIKGKATEKELKELLGAFESLAANKPPKGSAESWNTKTKALVDSVQGLIDKKEGASAALQGASDCMACHKDHKGK